MDEKKLKIKKRVAWYPSSTVQNIVVAHRVLRIIQLAVKLSSVAPVSVCQIWNSWSEKLKEQNKNQASKQNNLPANNKRIKNTNQTRQKCSLLTPQHNRIRISWICRFISLHSLQQNTVQISVFATYSQIPNASFILSLCRLQAKYN